MLLLFLFCIKSSVCVTRRDEAGRCIMGCVSAPRGSLCLWVSGVTSKKIPPMRRGFASDPAGPHRRLGGGVPTSSLFDVTRRLVLRSATTAVALPHEAPGDASDTSASQLEEHENSS